LDALAVLEEYEALFISSFAVAPEYRRHRIATYMLNYVNKLAARLDNKWIELSVLKANPSCAATLSGIRVRKP